MNDKQADNDSIIVPSTRRELVSSGSNALVKRGLDLIRGAGDRTHAEAQEYFRLAVTRLASVRDGLTGCFNRWFAIDVIDVELRRAQQSQRPVSLIMFDIDHFKDINDRFGHVCGDAVLAAVGAKMHELMRGSDLKCRYGDKTFLLFLPETPLAAAERVADILRRELAEMQITWADHTTTITATFGVAAAPPSELDTQALMGRASAALARAKDRGGNYVCLDIDDAAATSDATIGIGEGDEVPEPGWATQEQIVAVRAQIANARNIGASHSTMITASGKSPRF